MFTFLHPLPKRYRKKGNLLSFGLSWAPVFTAPLHVIECQHRLGPRRDMIEIRPPALVAILTSPKRKHMTCSDTLCISCMPVILLTYHVFYKVRFIYQYSTDEKTGAQKGFATSKQQGHGWAWISLTPKPKGFALLAELLQPKRAALMIISCVVWARPFLPWVSDSHPHRSMWAGSLLLKLQSMGQQLWLHPGPC